MKATISMYRVYMAYKASFVLYDHFFEAFAMRKGLQACFSIPVEHVESLNLSRYEKFGLPSDGSSTLRKLDGNFVCIDVPRCSWSDEIVIKNDFYIRCCYRDKYFKRKFSVLSSDILNYIIDLDVKIAERISNKNCKANRERLFAKLDKYTAYWNELPPAELFDNFLRASIK